MSLLPRLLTSVVVVATLNSRCYMSINSAWNSHEVTEQEPSQPPYRLWNDSYIWPAPQFEVYEHLQAADGINTTRVLFYNDWEFVYDVDSSSTDSDSNTNTETANINDDSNNTTERWSIIMTAAKERFQHFLNQSITSNNKAFSNEIETSKTVTSGNIMIPLKGIRFHISNLTETKMYYGMDESYDIKILNPLLSSFHVAEETTGSIQNMSNYVEITSTNVFGAIYGLETLKQLIQFVGFSDDNKTDDEEKVAIFGIFDNIYKLYIHDSPVYTYRGIMIDTARHYLPLSLIQQNLIVMMTNKLNVLHWHMSDSQSFPYSSIKFPELARHGAYCYPECVYTTSNVEMIIEAAALLGIHVIIEIDLPGHSQAIGNSHPELLSKCSNDVLSEPLNVTDDALYDFVYGLYDEITQLFTDDYIHLGGDEVSLDCWESSTSIQQWMQSHNMTKTVEVLQYFEMNLLEYVLNVTKKRPIVWQDLFDMDVKGIPSNVIFDVWKDWIPGNMPNLTFAQQSRILGGHTSMWGESVDSTNFYERVWPRSSATAEVLWSGSPRNISTELSSDHVQARLARFRCYMLAQFNVPISPIFPGHCQAHGPLLVVQDVQSIKT